MAAIDTALDGVYLSDPRLTVSPEARP